MTSELWYLLLRGALGQHVRAFADLYVYGEHLGAALHKAKEYAGVIGLKDCHLVEAFPLSRIGCHQIPEGTERLAEDVYLGTGLNTFRVGTADTPFILPTGIASSSADGILDIAGNAEHFKIEAPGSDGVFTLVLVIGERNLKQMYFRLCGLMPDIDTLTLLIKDCQGSVQTAEVWVNRELQGKRPILAFIKENLPNTLENGFVELSLDVREGITCLTLDDHKLLTLTTRDEKLFKFLHTSIGHFGIKEAAAISAPWRDYKHWHYRPYNSLDKETFTQLIIRKGFMAVKNARIENQKFSLGFRK